MELAAHYDCTRSTVGRALRDLATAGFLDRKRKGGTTVSANPVRKAPLDVPIIAEAIRKAGHVAGYQLLDAGERLPDPTLAPELGLPAGTPLLFIAAVHLADGAPHQVEHRWLLPATVQGLSRDILETTPADEWLLRNVPLTRAQITIEAVRAPNCIGCPARRTRHTNVADHANKLAAGTVDRGIAAVSCTGSPAGNRHIKHIAECRAAVFGPSNAL